MGNNFRILKTIGKELRTIRNNKDISLAEVAELAGVSTNYISEIERNKKVPSDEVIEKLAVVYNVEEQELYEGFGKLTEDMVTEVLNHPPLFEVIYKLSENPNITDVEKCLFYDSIHKLYVKMIKAD